MQFKRKVEALVKSCFILPSFLMTVRGTSNFLPLIPCKKWRILASSLKPWYDVVVASRRDAPDWKLACFEKYQGKVLFVSWADHETVEILFSRATIMRLMWTSPRRYPFKMKWASRPRPFLHGSQMRAHVMGWFFSKMCL